MKTKLIKVSAFLLIVGTAFVACKKDDDTATVAASSTTSTATTSTSGSTTTTTSGTTTGATTTNSADSSKAKIVIKNDAAMNDAAEIASSTDASAATTQRNAKKGTTVLGCGTVTVASKAAVGQLTAIEVTIDFGTTPTTCTDGFTRSGSFTVAYNQYPVAVGTTQTLTFNNYTVNGQSVTGKRVMTVLEKTTTSFKQQIVVTGGTYTDATGTATFESDRTRTMVAGLSTADVTDDKWSFTGTSSGKTVFGDTYKLDVKTGDPVITLGNCKYIYVDGTFDLTMNSNTGTVDFGDGTCDPFATLSMNGSAAVTFNFWE